MTIPNARKDAEKMALSHIVDGNVKWYSHSEEQFHIKKKKKGTNTYLIYNLAIALLGIYLEK